MTLFVTNARFDLVGITILVLLMIASRREAKKKKAQGLFLGLLITNMLVLVADVFAWMLSGQTFRGARTMHIQFNSIYFVLQAVYAYLWLLYTTYWTHRSWAHVLSRYKPYSILLIIELIMLLVNHWTGWVWQVDENNIYFRGEWFNLITSPVYIYIVWAVVMALVYAIRSSDAETRRNSRYMVAFMLLPVLGTVFEVLSYGVSLLWTTVALSLLMIYLNVQQRALTLSRLRELETQKEVQQANLNVMLSQIQPHFLYNALYVIQDLCYGKAPEAEAAIVDFAEYLRGNLDSLTDTSLISFDRELKHTLNYLSLEERRFGSRLQIEYDITARDFQLPALSLQPLVENAIRHGVTKREKGGCIRISTQEQENCYIVTVSDDGDGFDIFREKSDGRSHTGIKSVRSRLNRMCGGDLTLHSEKGVGTQAVITIPKEVEV